MKKQLVKCEATKEGGPSQETCSWYGGPHCASYNVGRNRGKCQRWEHRRKLKKQ